MFDVHCFVYTKEMKYVRHFFISVLILLNATSVWAYCFKMDSICYKIISDTAPYEVMVIHNPDFFHPYSGNMEIPQTLNYGGIIYSVTSIGNSAFSNCTSLTSVTIPNTVTSIGNSAFSNCASLTSVTIPNSVMSIGSYAFSGCLALTSITIPNSVTSIEEAGFEGCTRLSSITIPNSVTSIGSYAFMGCINLTSITIPNSVTNIETDAFCGCIGLTYIDIPNSVTSIEHSAFYGCSGLNSINIPASVTNIEDFAFYGCTNLTSIVVDSDNPTYDSRNNCNAIILSYSNSLIRGCKTTTIPNSVTSIIHDAFSGCTGLTSIIIPNSVNNIGEDAFVGCTSLSIVVDPDNPTYDSRDNCNAIIHTSSNTLIRGCKATIIPNSVTSINHYAFSGCNDLTSIVIPNSVTSIGEYAFYGCTDLSSIEIPNSVKDIGRYAFDGCTSLASMVIPNSVTNIGEYAFYECTGLASIEIPNSVTSIGYRTFSGCTGLASIVVDSGNPTYDSRNNCNAIIETSFNTLIFGCKTTTIPNSVTSIGGFAFSGQSGLTSIEIPNSVTTIRDRAFYECTGLTSITIPNSVTRIESSTFSGCTSLTSTTIPNSVTTIKDRAFYGCTDLTSINIPNSVTSIGSLAFGGCKSLSSMTIPNSVTSLGGNTFYDTGIYNLESNWELGALYIDDCLINVMRDFVSNFTINSETRLIADNVFSDWDLTSIAVKATTPPIAEMSNLSQEISLCVPCGCKDVYQNDSFWGGFSSIIERDFTYEIALLSSNENLGSARITHQDCESGNATVYAEPRNGNAFRNWTVNGQMVSTSNPYTFSVVNDIEIMANFSGMGIEEESVQRVLVSPNPAKERVNVICKEMRNLSLFSSDGRMAKTINAIDANEMEIDMSGLAKGLYMLRIETQNGKTINRKIIVQ